MPNEAATLLFEDPRWRRSYKAIADDMHAATKLILHHAGVALPFNVLFTNNYEIQSLNRDFRGKDWPTNVLSFPSGEEDNLGDIALAYEYVADEKQRHKKSWRAHTTHLVMHGLLHLLGYDHEDDDDAEEMEALEIELLKQLHIANPYI